MVLESDVFYSIIVACVGIIFLQGLLSAFLPLTTRQKLSHASLHSAILLYSTCVILCFAPDLTPALRRLAANGAYAFGISTILAMAYFSATISRQTEELKKPLHLFFMAILIIIAVISLSGMVVTDVRVVDGLVSFEYGLLRDFFGLVFVAYGLLYIIRAYWKGYAFIMDDQGRSLVLSIFVLQVLIWFIALVINILLPDLMGNSYTLMVIPIALTVLNASFITVIYANNSISRLYRFLFRPAEQKVYSLAHYVKQREIINLLEVARKKGS